MYWVLMALGWKNDRLGVWTEMGGLALYRLWMGGMV